MRPRLLVPSRINIPDIGTLLDTLNHDGAVMRMLGTSSQTLKKWRAEKKCPLSVLYAVFWISPLGISLLRSQISATEENMLLRDEIAVLERRIHAFESAARSRFGASPNGLCESKV